MQKIVFESEIYSFQVDFYGPVSNIVYIQWLEIARTKLLEAVGMPAPKILRQGIVPILAQTKIDYKSPLYLGDRVRVEMWIAELKNASIILQFRFYNAREMLAAEGWQKALFTDKQTMRPRRFSSEERSLFGPYVHSTEKVQLLKQSSIGTDYTSDKTNGISKETTHDTTSKYCSVQPKWTSNSVSTRAATDLRSGSGETNLKLAG